MKSNRRYDLSGRLIHFFRKLDLEDGSAPDMPEDFGLTNITESTEYSAIFLLRSAIRHGRLWATWSKRNEARTVYGPRPAICFTEMPTAAFLEASAERLRAGQKISTLALTFPKPQLYGLGARPVIYGLSINDADIPKGRGGGPRIIPTDALPLNEQYRYVTYSPTGRWRVDWTHEREWRWPYTGDLAEYEAAIEEYGVVEGVRDIPGLDLYTGDIHGIGVIVNTREEARMVLHDVLALVDRQDIVPDTFEYVLVSDNIRAPESIRDPIAEAAVIAGATIDLSDYLTPQSDRDRTISDRVHALAEQVEDRAGPSEAGEFGGCWLWLVDNVHPVTRALLNSGKLVVNQDRKYLMFPYEFSDDRSLRQRETMTKELARLVNEEFGIEAGYFSVLMSGDPDDLPNYHTDFLDNELHFNWWSYGL